MAQGPNRDREGAVAVRLVPAGSTLAGGGREVRREVHPRELVLATRPKRLEAGDFTDAIDHDRHEAIGVLRRTSVSVVSAMSATGRIRTSVSSAFATIWRVG